MNQNIYDLAYLAGLSRFVKFGPVRLKRLKKHFSLWKNAFYSDSKGLLAAGIEEIIANEFISARKDINIEGIWQKLEQEKIKITTPEDKNYPTLLREIPDAPALLYYKGTLLENMGRNLAVVGTRKFTAYGENVTEKIIKELSKSGLTIVSGLAVGIDTIAHRTALRCGLPTIGVLGCGLDEKSFYPAHNKKLSEEIIAAGGAVISEFPMGTAPLKQNFPQRNRIVAGMSLGTLVIEADIKSGSLITARLALDYNRDVMAVPGNIFSTVSLGTNEFIKNGAKLVASAEDVMEALNIPTVSAQKQTVIITFDSQEEQLIYDNLTAEPRHVNELARLTRLDTGKINGTLAIMELKGIAKNTGNMSYIKNNL